MTKNLLSLSLAVTLLAAPPALHANSANWDGDTNTLWNNDNNWSAPNPNGTTQIATFNQATYLNNPSLNVNRSISRLTFGASNGGVSLNPVGAFGLTLNDASGVGIDMLAGSGASSVNVPVTLAAAVNFRNSSSSLLTVSGSLNNGGFQLGLVTTSVGNNILLSGTMTGAGRIAKIGLGTATLSSNSIGYTGSTLVNAGTLLVNGTFVGAGSGVSVGVTGTAATLGGIGSINRATTINDTGILSAGDVISGVSQGGTLTFTNGLTLNNASSLLFDLSTPASILDDQIDVTGDFTLDGALTVNQLSGFTNGSYLLFAYSGGTFTNNGVTINPLSGGLTASIDTSIAGEVRLTVVPEPSAAVAFLFGAGFLLLGRRSRLGHSVRSEA